MRTISFVIVVLISLSCQTAIRADVKDGKVIQINLDSLKEIYPVVENAVHLKLDNANDEAIIGEIKKIIKQNNNLYILDSRFSKDVFVYGTDGKYKFKLNKIGRGRNEYLNPDDIGVNNQGDIYVLDGNGRKVLVYDNNGTCKNVFVLDDSFNSMLLCNDKIVLDKGNYAAGGSDKYLSVINLEGKKIGEYFTKRKDMDNFTISPYTTLGLIQDTVRYFPSMSNKVYSIVNDEIITEYTFNFGDKWINDAFITRMKNENPLQIIKTLQAENYIMFPNYIETKDVIHLNFMYKDQRYHTFMDKLTGNTKTFCDKDGEIGRPLAIIGDKLVTTVRSIDDYEENPELLFISLNF